MRICLISNEYPPETGFGGIGTYTYNLAHGLYQAGHDVSVITQALNNEKNYKDGGVKVYRLRGKKIPFRGFTRIANFFVGREFGLYWQSKSIFQKIKELMDIGGKFDVIEAPLWNGEGVAYDARLGIPLVIRLQTPIFKLMEILSEKPKKVSEFIEKKSLEKAVLVAAISKDIGKMVASHYKISQNKIRLSYLGVELPKIKKPLFKSDSFKLLYVGRLEKRKGTSEFIEAIPKILKSNNKISIDIIGKDIPQAPGGIIFYEYFKKIVPQEYHKKVRFHGFVDKKKLEKFYANCDLFIAPSRYESFGLIFLEAMAYGKPVIGTKIGGIAEIVKDKKTGMLIDANNSKQIAGAVLKIFRSDKLRKEMGESAFGHVRKNFTVESMVKTTLDIYRQAIKIYKSENL